MFLASKSYSRQCINQFTCTFSLRIKLTHSTCYKDTKLKLPNQSNYFSTASTTMNNLNISEQKSTLTLNNINQNVITMEYAVRGPLVIRAGAIEKELASGVEKPFSEVIRANIGDCHAMGQRPLTFFRQVIACCTDTSLLGNNLYPKDVQERAKLLLSYCGGKSVGAYSDSAGIEIIRRHCAQYIEERDGVPSNWQDIVLTTGASEAVRAVLTLINTTRTDPKPTGVMIPIPQYPLYTATLAEYSMHPIKYYLGKISMKTKGF